MMDRDDEIRLMTARSYARMFGRDYIVNVRGIDLLVRPRSHLGSLKETWAYLAKKRARDAAEQAGLI